MADQESKRELRRAIRREHNANRKTRLETVLMHQSNFSNVAIANLLALSVNTVASYLRKYEEGGIEGLLYVKTPSGGRPARLSTEQESRLKDTICQKTPDEVGFEPHKNWTLELMIAYTEREFAASYSTSGMWDLMQRLKLSWTRPTYVLAKADPAKQAAFLEEFSDIKKTH